MPLAMSAAYACARRRSTRKSLGAGRCHLRGGSWRAPVRTAHRAPRGVGGRSTPFPALPDLGYAWRLRRGSTMQRLRPALAGLLLSACATVSERPAPVEAPVSRGKQIAAQSAAQAPAAHRYKTKIAIARFTNESNYGRSLLTDQDLDRIGKQAGDMLMSRLVLSGKFLVLERPDAAKLEREQKLSGGSMIGADTVIAGSVTEFGRSVGGKSGGLSSTKLQTAKARVDIRLVDVQTDVDLGLRRLQLGAAQEAALASHR